MRVISMNILYIHGWGSSFDENSKKCLALKKIGKVHGIDLDYTKTSNEIEQTLFQCIVEHDIDLLIGTSLGGYWAARMSKYGLLFVACNPAVNPNKTLIKYLGKGQTFTGHEYELALGTIQSYDEKWPNNGGIILLDDGDELLSSDETYHQLHENFTIHRFAGGCHRFEHMEESLDLISDFYGRSFLSLGC